jgi:hypothetical protein
MDTPRMKSGAKYCKCCSEILEDIKNGKWVDERDKKSEREWR